MQVFLRVAQTGSFASVANQLDVDRSWVTRQIASLEKHLGTKLITRSTRRLSLTPAGSIYLEKCRLILNMVDSAEADIADENTEPRGQIRLGLPLAFGLQVLTPLLLDFSKRHPMVELVTDLSDQRVNLIEEGLDLAIRITDSLQSGDVVRKLGVCPMLTFASPGYFASHGTPRHPRDLESHECLIYSNAASRAQWAYRDSGKKINVSVRGRITANNGIFLTEAAAQDRGITRQPLFIAKRYLDAGVIRPILQDFEGPDLGIYAVLPGNRYIPHRVSTLMTYLSDQLSE